MFLCGLLYSLLVILNFYVLSAFEPFGGFCSALSVRRSLFCKKKLPIGYWELPLEAPVFVWVPGPCFELRSPPPAAL